MTPELQVCSITFGCCAMSSKATKSYRILRIFSGAIIASRSFHCRIFMTTTLLACKDTTSHSICRCHGPLTHQQKYEPEMWSRLRMRAMRPRRRDQLHAAERHRETLRAPHNQLGDHMVGLLNHFPAPPNGYENPTTANVALCSSGTDCVVCDASNNVPRTCDETITVTYVPSTRAKKNKERIVLYRFCCVDCMKRTLGQLSVGDKLKKDRDIAYKKKDQNESSTYIVRNWSTGDARRARLTAALDE
mmetsp:Transcript_6277/g.23603  ORF Transcript_6277/g.23603 Transcript_6277/m.23603 type:complete len:247 (-) Transcript_6277:487-1227(-)